MPDIAIVPLEALTLPNFRPMLDESLAEGFGMIQKLWEEYESGKDRFDAPGAILMGVFEGDRLIGIGGIQPDPYLNRPEVGRVRHVYVLHEYRRQGVGRRLLGCLIQTARANFDLLTLRTPTLSAAAFYESLGFVNQPTFPESTHYLWLKQPHSFASENRLTD